MELLWKVRDVLRDKEVVEERDKEYHYSRLVSFGDSH